VASSAATKGVKAGVKAAARTAGHEAAKAGGQALKGARRHVDDLGKKTQKVWDDAAGGAGRKSADTVPVYRVEGPGNTRLLIDEAGDVAVTGQRQLYLTFGDRARADGFLALRHSQGHVDDVIKAFDVPQSYARSVRRRSVPQDRSRGAPVQRVDPTKTDSSFGLKSPEFPGLRRAIIPGSGRIVG
jgi:hypothetical protein